MSARAEAYPLGRIPKVRLDLIIIPLKLHEIHQHFLWRRLAGQLGDRVCFVGRFNHETGHAFTFQISAAYSAMVRSLENFPEPATFKMALRAHAVLSR